MTNSLFNSLLKMSKAQKRRERKKQQKAMTQADLDSSDFLYQLGQLFDALEVSLRRSGTRGEVSCDLLLVFQREEMREAALGKLLLVFVVCGPCRVLDPRRSVTVFVLLSVLSLSSSAREQGLEQVGGASAVFVFFCLVDRSQLRA